MLTPAQTEAKFQSQVIMAWVFFSFESIVLFWQITLTEPKYLSGVVIVKEINNSLIDLI